MLQYFDKKTAPTKLPPNYPNHFSWSFFPLKTLVFNFPSGLISSTSFSEKNIEFSWPTVGLFSERDSRGIDSFCGQNFPHVNQ